jgi:hypothetical protein
MKQIDRQIEDIEQGRFVPPKLLPAVTPETAAEPVVAEPVALSA